MRGPKNWAYRRGLTPKPKFAPKSKLYIYATPLRLKAISGPPFYWGMTKSTATAPKADYLDDTLEALITTTTLREVLRRVREDAMPTMPPPATPELMNGWAPPHARR